MKWDKRFLGLAQHIASWSKDPSTKVGAVVVDDQHRICGVGFNGFPRGVTDDPKRLEDRTVKLAVVQHAESNALAFSRKTEGCALYTWPIPPCAHCMGQAIQHGIKRVVSVESVPDRWRDSVALSMQIATEVGIIVDLFPESLEFRAVARTPAPHPAPPEPFD